MGAHSRRRRYGRSCRRTTSASACHSSPPSTRLPSRARLRSPSWICLRRCRNRASLERAGRPTWPSFERARSCDQNASSSAQVCHLARASRLLLPLSVPFLLLPLLRPLFLVLISMYLLATFFSAPRVPKTLSPAQGTARDPIVYGGPQFSE